MKRTQTLKELKLSRVSTETLRKFAEASVNFRQLESVKLYRIGYPDSDASSSDSEVFDDNSVSILFGKLNNIKSLSVQYCYDFDDATLNSFVSTTLLSIKLQDTSVTKESFVSFLRQSTQMQSIDLGDGTISFTNAVLQTIAKYCKNLEKLRIQKCVKLQDTTRLKKVIRECKVLECLVCPSSFTPRCFKETLESLCKHNNTLKEFQYIADDQLASNEEARDFNVDAVAAAFNKFGQTFKDTLTTLKLSMHASILKNVDFVLTLSSTFTSLEVLNLKGRVIMDESSLENTLKNNSKLKELKLNLVELTVKHCELINASGKQLGLVDVSSYEGTMRFKCFR